ncbi:YchJ family protein [Corynebacterium rouxii]|nr:YchJ family protein [Corynebacterium rouxii]
MMNCPCGSGRSYSDCCQPFHTKAKNAPTAESLMRSRYSAFVLGNEEYLLYSWAPETAPHSLNLEEFVTWHGLTVHQSCRGGLFDSTGIVEFTARYSAGGQMQSQHETSRFRRHDGRWVYVDGDL